MVAREGEAHGYKRSHLTEVGCTTPVCGAHRHRTFYWVLYFLHTMLDLYTAIHMKTNLFIHFVSA